MSTLPTESPQMLNQRQTAIVAPAITRRARRKRHPHRWVALLAIVFICCGFILPFLWMISTSLKTVSQTMTDPPQIIPHPAVPGNYWKVIISDKVDFPLYTRNTLVIAALSVLGTTLSSAVAAYGFAKIRFRGRGILFVLMLSTMMIPFPVMMLPLFMIFRFIGDHTPLQMLGTFRPLWLPTWFGSAFSIFLLRQFFLTIPDDLGEAARIDGCSEWGIFWRIMLPLSRPALAVVALFSFMWAWNNFLGPLLYLQRPEQYTLALGLQAFQSQQGGTDWNLLMAASMLVMLPVILLFFLAQKTFIRGIATTGLK
ncbi:MAG TPA: carbohydrate ABC transporter permease [Tepidisphaeraceae bacterium]|nr:carbohydrate ABC transporter permease [Tepidisphaeraceae bacterium]